MNENLNIIKFINSINVLSIEDIKNYDIDIYTFNTLNKKLHNNDYLKLLIYDYKYNIYYKNLYIMNEYANFLKLFVKYYNLTYKNLYLRRFNLSHFTINDYKYFVKRKIKIFYIYYVFKRFFNFDINDSIKYFNYKLKLL